MRDYTRNNYRDKRELQLIADGHLKTLPQPYGTFDKARYTLLVHNYRNPIYMFITTIRNTEECIEILLSKWSEQVRHEKYFAIFKEQGSNSKMIYTNKKVWKESNITISSIPTTNAGLN